ncbi:hypothetical protein EON67_11055 [archaeon]|nr:MAG: hypothetical protein EON67_11055 [archaeon]
MKEGEYTTPRGAPPPGITLDAIITVHYLRAVYVAAATVACVVTHAVCVRARHLWTTRACAHACRNKMLQGCMVREGFTMREHMKPHPARVKSNLSAIINYLKYAEVKQVTFTELQAGAVRECTAPPTLPRTASATAQQPAACTHCCHTAESPACGRDDGASRGAKFARAAHCGAVRAVSRRSCTRTAAARRWRRLHQRKKRCARRCPSLPCISYPPPLQASARGGDACGGGGACTNCIPHSGARRTGRQH